MAEFQYVRDLNRYRNVETGRFMAAVQVEAFVDLISVASGSAAQSLAGLVSDSSIGGEVFKQQFRQQVKQSYLQQAILGKGGRANMTFSDWGTIGAQLKKQYAFIDGMAAKVATGFYEGKEAALANRMQLYFDSSRQAFNRMQLSARDLPAMPQVPGDGQTACLTRCKCTLVFDKSGDEWHIFWILEPGAKHCVDCPVLADIWAPLIFANGSFQNLNLDALPISKANWLEMETAMLEWLDLMADETSFTVAASVFEHHEVHV